MNTIDDKKDYAVVNKAMKMIGFTDRERETVWKLVAAIIHLVCIEMFKIMVKLFLLYANLVSDSTLDITCRASFNI